MDVAVIRGNRHLEVRYPRGQETVRKGISVTQRSGSTYSHSFMRLRSGRLSVLASAPRTNFGSWRVVEESPRRLTKDAKPSLVTGSIVPWTS